MNLTLHLVRKDLRRLRWWLAAWIVVLLLPIALGVAVLARNPFAALSAWRADDTLGWLYALEGLVAYLLTILLLQEDAVLGTQQFWLTRPISRGRLLGAKLLAAFAVLALLPIAVSLPWWLWNGFGPAQIAVAALECIALAVLVAVPAMFIGTITETLSRAVLWTLVLVAFTVTSGAFLPRFGLSVFGGLAAAFVCLGLVAVWLFFTRRRGWRLLGFAALLPPLAFAATLIVVRLGPDRPLRERHAERAAGVGVRHVRTFADYIYEQRTGEGSARVPMQQVRSVFAVQGVAPDLALLPLGGWQTFQSGDLRRTEHSFPYWNEYAWHREPFARLGLREPGPDPETEAWKAELIARRSKLPADDVRHVAVEPPVEVLRQINLDSRVPPSIVARMVAEPPRFNSELWLRLSRPAIVYELSLQPGQRAHGRGFTARVATVGPDDPPHLRDAGKKLTVVETWPAPLTALIRDEINHRTWHRAMTPRLIAVNRARGEFVGVHVERPRRVVVHGVGIAWLEVDIHPGMIRRDGKWVRRPDWMQDARLALLSFTDEALVRREVRIERLAVENLRARGNAAR